MSSCDEEVSCDERFSEFLTNYKQPETQRQYEDLVKLTRTKCEKLLKRIDVKGVVQGRAKKYKSLKKKLEDPEFIKWISEGNKIYEHPDIGDLAGVRIGLYFPNDILKVVKKIKTRFKETHRFGTVTDDERHATPRGNKDIIEHGNGRWYTANPDGTVDYWKHSGYESWQMVVKWKEPLPEGLKSLRAQMPEGLNSLRVEIQLATVVTQAWAEVQHAIIYKRPREILATPTMKRMIDATNGLAITTDIMLKELERSLEDAKKEAKARDKKPFRRGAEFLSWFQSTYLSQMPLEERQRWVCSEN